MRSCGSPGSSIERVDNLGDGLATDGAFVADDFAAVIAHASVSAGDQHCVDVFSEADFA